MTQPLPGRVQLVSDAIIASFDSAAVETVRIGEYPHSPSVIVTTTDPSLIHDLRALEAGVPTAVYRRHLHHLRNGDKA